MGGLAWVIPSRILTGSAYLRLLLVCGERQRAGLGSRLLGEAEARARRGANHLVLLVTTDNAGRVGAWDLVEGKSVALFGEVRERVADVAFAPDERSVLVAFESGDVSRYACSSHRALACCRLSAPGWARTRGWR